MPITPFHFGVGAALSSVAPTRIRFLAFCVVNVVIDVESLYHLLAGQHPVHTFLHTYPGAALAALLTWGGLVWALRVPGVRARVLVFGPRSLMPGALALGCVLGALTHVLLDSIMHADMRPLAPFSGANGMLGLISLADLHLLCLLGFVVGAVVFLIRQLVARSLRR